MSLTPPRSLVTQYLYVELATKERPHHHAGNQTTALQHAKDVKDLVSEVRWGFYTTCPFAKEYFQSFPLAISGENFLTTKRAQHHPTAEVVLYK